LANPFWDYFACNNKTLQKRCFPKSRRGKQMGSALMRHWSRREHTIQELRKKSGNDDLALMMFVTDQ
jgi:hypothetical protein